MLARSINWRIEQQHAGNAVPAKPNTRRKKSTKQSHLGRRGEQKAQFPPQHGKIGKLLINTWQEIKKVKFMQEEKNNKEFFGCVYAWGFKT